MSDKKPVPAWSTPQAKAKALQTKRNWRDIDAALLTFIGDRLGAEAFFSQFWHGEPEDKRALLQFVGRRMPQQIEGHIDHALQITIVKQVGNREIVIDGSQARNLGHPPKDAHTGEAMEVVPDKA